MIKRNATFIALASVLFAGFTVAAIAAEAETSKKAKGASAGSKGIIIHDKNKKKGASSGEKRIIVHDKK